MLSRNSRNINASKITRYCSVILDSAWGPPTHAQNGIRNNFIIKVFCVQFEANHERLLHLSIIRKLFSESAPCLPPVELNQSNQASSDVGPTAVDVTAKADLCRSLLEKDVFLSNMVLNL